MCRHYDCIFYSPDTESCDFSYIMGRLRGCDPTEDCREYRIIPAGIKPILLNYHWHKKDLAAVARLRKYYPKSESIVDLAEKARVKITMAKKWTQKEHPESEWLKGPRHG